MKTIVTITGASGAGKDSMLDAVMLINGCKDESDASKMALCVRDFHPTKLLKIHEIISHTTRQPREGEVDGKDYYYIDLDTFNTLVKVEETEYAGNHYCIAASELEKIEDGGFGIVVVDRHGVECLRKFAAKNTGYCVLSLFLQIDAETSEKRMRGRGDSEESIKKRLAQHEERNEYTVPDNDYFIMDATDNSDFETTVAAFNSLLRSMLTENKA